MSLLALIGWTGLARQVRGQVLSIRERDYVTASLGGGGGTVHIMREHVIPNTLSHIIVVTTLALPDMIPGGERAEFSWGWGSVRR